MKLDILNRKVDKILILLALRVKFKGLEPSISDYHKDLKKIFNIDLRYNTIRKRLAKLDEQGLLKSELIKGFVRNDLVNSKGEIKLKRHTIVYKRVYTINDESKALRQFVKALKSLSKELFKRNLSQAVGNDELLRSLA